MKWHEIRVTLKTSNGFARMTPEEKAPSGVAESVFVPISAKLRRFPMLLRLLLLFVTVPLVELYLLLRLADVTGPAATFLLVIITGIIGSWLAKREGVMAWQKFHAALAEGRVPSREIQDGLMIVFAAALLLTPGLLTDIVGFVMLVPVGRELIRKFIFSKMFRGFGKLQIKTSTFESNRMHSFDEAKTVDGKVSGR